MKGNAKAKQVKGMLKETIGKTISDRHMQRAGKNDQLRGKAQEMAEKAAERVRKGIGH
ncbi:CsbD family protein [Streptomyces formicae]|uniref:CsbD family protein n=1 Tax=Streptomyces formicae TaxID=1616117 RepID=A0ABY3WJS4_9ACTN|nr:CsbD family protein [Streptomyces formicae]UNM11861.1 CsbD family protein [Streptomyces formicae]